MDALELVIEERPTGEFTFERLADLVEHYTEIELAAALDELIRRGRLRQIVRVESPHGRGGIKDFDSILEVPDRIHDYRTDTDLDITPSNLRVLYRAAGR